MQKMIPIKMYLVIDGKIFVEFFLRLILTRSSFPLTSGPGSSKDLLVNPKAPGSLGLV